MVDQTIHQMFRQTVERFGDRKALGSRQDGAYHFYTYTEVWARVSAFRRGLWALGMRKGDRIAILSENRAEWAIADLAAQSMGVVTVPIYSTLPAAQVQYLVGDSAARILIASDKKQLAKAVEILPNVRTLEYVVAIEDPQKSLASLKIELPEEQAARVLAFEEIIQKGETTDLRDDEIDAVAASMSPDDVATLIYTSGTTGDPKGAMLTHRNLLHTGYAVREITRIDENDVFLSFLPLCHIIERTGGHYLPLSVGAQIVYSDGVFAIGNEIGEVKPTVFLCVPRLFENMQEKVAEQTAKLPDRQRKVLQWAITVGEECVRKQTDRRPIGPILAIKRAIADKLVLSKLRDKVSGGRLRFFVSGGAPLNPNTFLFFQALGVHILEGYGLTELPVICLNRPGQERLGTVGQPLPQLDVKIAADGEILARGPGLMRGYFGKPEATADAIDSDGWCHTGDIGELSADGYLKITDRKKDIIVLANGKNVAPQPIEAHLKESLFISEIVLIGDKSSAIVAIIVPAFDKLKAWAKDHELGLNDFAALMTRAETRKLYKDELDRLSIRLADFERVKRFTLVDKPFTIETGELTPTLKVKRKFIAQKYAGLIEQLVR